uniref:BEN domain-containing protein n=1 Tax=Trichogramma kaykai TaxID=54128 RepID=A0ABD2WWA6_9HYME
MNSLISKKLGDIEDKYCVLVEFVNENEKKIDIGFVPWIKNENDEKEIVELIENGKIVEMYWPDCSTYSARTLKSQLKNVEFNIEPVKILATGSWDYTKEKLENFKTHGTIEITKDSRKNRKKKIDQNYVYDMKNKESERKTKQQQSDLTEQQKEKKEESPRLLEKVVSEMKKSSIVSNHEMNNIIQDAQKVLSNFKSLKTRKRTANDTVDEEVELKISKPSTNNKLKKEGSTKATEDKKKKTVGVRLTMDPTNYTLSEKDKAGLPRKDISEYTIAILNRLFSPDELLNSSVTGKPANYNPDAPVRPGLSPNRLHAARSNLPLILLL